MPASAVKSVALKRKLTEIYDRLLAAYGPQKCFLNHETPFQLLVATILSAQCTDKMVNRVTESLFRDYPEQIYVARKDSPMILGLTGAIVGFFLQWGVYALVSRAISTSDTIQLIKILSFQPMALWVLGAFLITGLVIGVVGSMLAIRKFLQV